MAYITFKNLEEYELKIERLYKRAPGLVKQAVYVGAGVMADAMREALEGLPIEEGRNGLPPYASPGPKIKGVSKKQKRDLLDSMGLTEITEENGYVSTKLGWDGYGSVPTKQWPRGVPNVMLMRSIESGTRFRKKIPVVRQTVTRSRNLVTRKMAEKVDKLIEKEMK